MVPRGFKGYGTEGVSRGSVPKGFLVMQAYRLPAIIDSKRSFLNDPCGGGRSLIFKTCTWNTLVFFSHFIFLITSSFGVLSGMVLRC